MSEAVPAAYRVNGRVTFANLMHIREEGEAAIAEAGDPVVIDFTGLENGNSAAVALLMAWLRAADDLGKSIEFVAAPTELENIVELSGMTDVLPMRSRAVAPVSSDGEVVR